MDGLKNKYIVFIYILFSVSLLNGCGKPAEKVENTTKATDWPEEVSYCSTGLPNIAISGDRVLYVDEGIMYIRDSKSGVDAVLCTHPNCTHPSHSATGGGSHCEATSPPNAFGDFEAVALHGDTVFQFFEVEVSGDIELQLYVSHVGQSGRKKVAVLPYKLGRDMYFQGDYLYCLVKELGNDEDKERQINTRCVLVRMDLDTYEITELDECFGGSNLQAGRLDYSDGVLVYEILDTDKKGDCYSTVHLYNVETKENKVLDLDTFYENDYYFRYVGYWGGYIYYVTESDDSIIKRKVDTGEEISIAEIEKGKVLYWCSIQNGMGISYETSDKDTANGDDWDSKDKRMYYYSFEDGKTYPVKSEYVNRGVMIQSKNIAYYLELKDDAFKIRWLTLDEYLDKEED